MDIRYKRLIAALISGGVFSSCGLAQAGGSLTGMDDAGGLPANIGTGLNGLSGDGNLAVGAVRLDAYTYRAYTFSESGAHALALPGDIPDWTVAQAASGNGGTIAGYAFYSGTYTRPYAALAWENGVLSVLPDLGTDPRSSQALGVSGDGNVIVGTSYAGTLMTGGGYHAARWVKGDSGWSVQDINGGGLYSTRAVDADATGATVVGYGASETFHYVGSTLVHDGGYLEEAFRWTAAGGMAGLGVLAEDNHYFDSNPSKPQSRATGVSADGNVVVGWSAGPDAEGNNGSVKQAFRWTQEGGMAGLGALAGGSFSEAYDVNADGTVVVGTSDRPYFVNGVQMNFNQVTAFRWTAEGGMQSIADWLTENGVNVGSNTFKDAKAVDASGNVVAGVGQINGHTQQFIARVTGAAGGGSGGGNSNTGGSGTGGSGGAGGSGNTGGGNVGGGSGVIGMLDFYNSLYDTAMLLGTGASITQMTLFGAHHRPLMDMGLPAGGCAWATADYGRHHDSDVRQHLEEVGVCGDFGPTRLGIGVGNSGVRQNLAFGGDGDYRGQHLLAEADYRIGTSLIASLTGLYGRWDVEMDRHYLNGANIDRSRGETDARVWALRARLDWLDLVKWQQSSLSPYVAYTHTRNEMDGYRERGGAFPVQYEDSTHAARELRLGASFKTALSADADLRLTGEAVHRFDDHGGAVQGQIIGVSSFRLPGAEVRQDWVRAGAEVDYRVRAGSVLSASLNTSSEGEDATWSGSVSWKLAF